MKSRDRGRARRQALPSGVHSTRLHLTLYSLLLIFTPFIMLRNYLQDAIGRLSLSRITIAALDLPAVPIAALGVLVLALVLIRSRIRPRHLLAALVGAGMIALAQRITDYYFGHRFYEIQVNWHYFAYGIFAFMVYRDLRPRGVPLSRCLLATVGLAAAYSTVDEAVQLAISSRIFDVSDIAKDVWGAVAGMTVILLGAAHPELAGGAWRRLRQRRVASYLDHAPGAWILSVIFGLCFLSSASLFTESRNAGIVLALTVASFLVIATIFHLSQFRGPRIAMTALGFLALVVQSGSCIRHRDGQFVHHVTGLTVYKGLPIPFVDVMVLPDGRIRAVDKKHYFNPRDRDFFMKKKPDILLIGSGYRGQGGKGFPHQRGARFVYNPHTNRGTQVIILDSNEACAAFERLKGEGKHVLFVLHTSC